MNDPCRISRMMQGTEEPCHGACNWIQSFKDGVLVRGHCEIRLASLEGLIVLMDANVPLEVLLWSLARFASCQQQIVYCRREVSPWQLLQMLWVMVGKNQSDYWCCL